MRRIEKVKEKSPFLRSILLFFPSPRKTEPRFCFPLRFFFFLAAYILMILYIAYLSYQNINQNPQIEIFIDNNAEIYAPIVYLYASFKLNVNCSYVDSNGNLFNSEDCTPRLKSEQTTEASSTTYSTIFRRDDFNIPEGGIYFDIYTVGNITDDVYLNLLHIDYESEIASIKGTQKNQDLQSKLLTKNLNENFYVLSPNKSNLILFESVRHEDLDGYSILSKFRKIKYHAVVSRHVIKSYGGQPNSSFYGGLQVMNQSSIEIVQQQTWNYDVPSILSAIGGAWAIATATYLFLFGVDSNSALGVPRAIWRSYRKRKEVKLNPEKMGILLEDYLVDIDEVIFHNTPEGDNDASEGDKDTHG
ncbi:18081_t:CDS:2 [Acaulospora morrowiae]|uniref:18081_t:CDS:1 n=1 Tax=Acaulospora morrowiae TaxID=94023 RepID=A0A9N8WGI3_9GLOM|nr:18081_t:CDS:2 [Acaulospora morrowiae]